MGKGTGKRKVRASARHAYAFPRSWQRRGHREGPALPGRAFTAQAAAAPLFPGPRGRAWRGWLAPERLRRELSHPSVYSERRPDLQAGACARRVSRVPGGSGVARGGGGLGGATRPGAELVSAARRARGLGLPAPRGPSGGSRPTPELPTEAPSAAPRPQGPRARAERLCGRARRGTWQTLPGAGVGGPPSGSPEGRLLPPLARPPRAASAPGPAARPPVPPAAPGARPAAEPGPPARPVRDGAPGRLSCRSARPPRGGRSRRRAAAREWRRLAAASPAVTGLGTAPTRTPGPLAPRRPAPAPAPARARPPGSRSASCASASASSTRSWAPRGTTWAPCASCSRLVSPGSAGTAFPPAARPAVFPTTCGRGPCGWRVASGAPRGARGKRGGSKLLQGCCPVSFFPGRRTVLLRPGLSRTPLTRGARCPFVFSSPSSPFK